MMVRQGSVQPTAPNIMEMDLVDGKVTTIVLFKSLRNSKSCNRGNFTSKSNSNKIKLFGGGGNIILF